MPFAANINRAELAERRDVPKEFIAWPFVDELYDYTQILNSENPIGYIPEDVKKIHPKVAIIGAGVGGMVAAFELMRMGLHPVIYEATDRIGGRTWSAPFNPSVSAFAEMGAMRVPVSNKVFYYYVDQFKLPVLENFPDPGKVLTQLYYENKSYVWKPGPSPDEPLPPPGPFKRIQRDYDGFISPLTKEIYAPWIKATQSQGSQREKYFEDVAEVWQRYIDRYKNMSFYEAVQQGIPHWTTEDLNAFGALGVGSGGFGPLYEVGFLEMLRLTVNQWEVDQQWVATGINGLTDSFYTREAIWKDGTRTKNVSLKSLHSVKLNTPVTGIQYNELTRNPVVFHKNSKTGKIESQEYQAVIVATTTRSMEFMGLTLPTTSKGIVAPSVRNSIKNLHLMESSKLFIRTRDKFWKNDPSIPQNIQTDELPRGVYCLDYPDDITTDGIVLISYTWGDDSAKLLGVGKEDRFEIFKRTLGVINANFASHLIPVDDDILNVDWESMPYYYGAFKLQYPGQEADAHAAFFQYKTASDEEADRGVYLAGDSVSWAGGWTEGALHTGLNAVCAVAKRFNASFPKGSPLDMDTDLYTY
jgi:tryptophan 2-monooxygenase